MRDLYWLTVLGNVHAVLVALCVFTATFSLIFACTYINEKNEGSENAERKAKNILILFVSGFFISSVGLVFTPSQGQLYAIYGIGSTIDYMKDNPEVKKLPDNIMKAVNAYFEQYQQEKQPKENGTRED